MHVCGLVRARTCHSRHAGPRRTCVSWFSPATAWALRASAGTLSWSEPPGCTTFQLSWLCAVVCSPHAIWHPLTKCFALFYTSLNSLCISLNFPSGYICFIFAVLRRFEGNSIKNENKQNQTSQVDSKLLKDNLKSASNKIQDGQLCSRIKCYVSYLIHLFSLPYCPTYTGRYLSVCCKVDSEKSFVLHDLTLVWLALI